jgi:site-specific recombinase XerD
MNVLDPEKIELPTVRRNFLDALSDDEIKALLKATNIRTDGRRKDKDLYEDKIDGAEYMIRARAIIEILLGSGIRVSELCGLKVTDLDLKEKYFYVTGKGDKKRICFLNDTTVFWVQKYLLTRRNDIVYLFSRYADMGNSQRLTTRSVERLVSDFGKKAGIKNPVTPHTLRRTYAAQLLKKGVDLRYIQDLMGHESITTTTFYTKIVRADLENVYRKANKKQVKNVKESEQVILSRESFSKLTGMVGKTVEQQAKILRKLEKEEKEKEKMNKIVEKPLIPLRKQLSIN